jgi:hypothetical protein
MADPSDREVLWRDYALNADLYKFYMDLMSKANVYYYGITGAIVSFCVSRSSLEYTRWALLLPIIISVFLAFIFAWSSRSAMVMSADTAQLSNRLKLGNYHDFTPLVYLLVASAVLQIVCLVGLSFLLWKLGHSQPCPLGVP